MSAASDEIASIRAFNRFYTRHIGLLGEGLLASAYSLTESRVLYELAQRDGLTASDLTRDLGLDPGYLSRILARFAEKGLLTKTPSPTDGRHALLTLTDTGRAAFAPLDAASRAQLTEMLSGLTSSERKTLVAAMRNIQTLLGPRRQPAVPFIVRPPQVGDIGWIIRRQGMLYAEEYGWDETYEALVAEILASFVRNFDPNVERGWIAERNGEIAGSVFLVRKSEEVAKLRLLYVEPSARGLGIGRRLVEECIAFARLKGYSTMTLWTNDILVAARRIYEEAGFRLVDQEPHHSFGKDLVGQTWELDLRS